MGQQFDTIGESSGAGPKALHALSSPRHGSETPANFPTPDCYSNRDSDSGPLDLQPYMLTTRPSRQLIKRRYIDAIFKELLKIRRNPMAKYLIGLEKSMLPNIMQKNI
ncbi:unnamed protein product, partial [Brenthis ino]